MSLSKKIQNSELRYCSGLISSIFLILLIGLDAFAGDYYWDNSTNFGYQSGNGTWGTDNFWTVDGVNLVAWPGAGNTATFAGADGNYVITVNGTQNVDSMAFSYNGYTLNGGTVNLGTKSGIYVADGKKATINSVINGSNGIVKYGSGELFLDGNNIFTGVSVVRAGKLTLNHANSLGATSSGTIVADGASIILRGNQITYAPEPLTINGPGIAFPGAIRTTASSPHDIVTWQGTVTLGSNSTIGATDSTDQVTVSGEISGSVQLTTGGQGTVILSGSNSFSGGLVVNTGILKAGNAQALGDFSNNISVNEGAALDINGYDLRNYSQNIVIKGQRDDSTGALINTGDEQVNAIRQISLGNNASIGNNGARFDIGRGYTGAVRIFGNNFTLTKVGSNFVALLADATALSGLIIRGGQLSLESNSAAGNATITIDSGAVLVSWGNRTFSNNVIINDGGQLNSPNNNTHTTVYNGQFTVNGLATLHSVASNKLIIGGPIFGAGGIVKTGPSGIVALAGNNAYGGSTTISEGTLQIGNGGTGGSITGDIVNNATLEFNRSDAYVFSNKISGTGDLVKSNSNILTLNGANTYSGVTTVSGGTLVVGHNTALGTSSGNTVVSAGSSPYPVLSLADGVTVTGETLVLNSDSATGGRSSLYAAAGVNAIWNGTVTLAGNDRAQIYAHGNLQLKGAINGSSYMLLIRGDGEGVISSKVTIGNTALVKADAGSWTVRSTGNQWGNTAVAVGTLSLGASNALPENTILSIGQPDNSDAAFDLNGYDQTVAGLADNGQIGGLRKITNSGSSESELTINNSSDFTYSNLIEDGSGKVSLIKTGKGTQILSRTSHTFSGKTVIENGTLAVASEGSIYNGGMIDGEMIIKRGGTFRIDRQDIFGGHLSFPSVTITIDSGGVLKSNGFFNTLGPIVLNGGTLLADGGDSTYGWGVWSLHGKVSVIGSNTSFIATGAGSANYIKIGNCNAGGTTEFDVADSAYGDDLVVSAELCDDIESESPYSKNVTSGLVKTGNGTMVLSGHNTFTGPVNVSAGTMKINGSTDPACTVTVKGTLSGTGNAAGAVTVLDSGTISPGDEGAGKLSTGPLTLNKFSKLVFQLGNSSDQLQVNGDLTLDGILDIVQLSELKESTFTLITYSGALQDNGLNIGSAPAGRKYTISAGDGAVTLKVIQTPVYTWDVSDEADFQAGNGTWGENEYWSVDGTKLEPWPGEGHTARFAGSNGEWNVEVKGIQDVDSIVFLNSGYVLSDGGINFGSKGGVYLAKGISVTINSVISGTGGLKVSAEGGSLSRLFLQGSNNYSGPTIIGNDAEINVVEIADGASNSSIGLSESAAQNLVLDGGRLRYVGTGASTDRLFTLTANGGRLFSSGSGPVIFTNNGHISFSGTGNRYFELGGISEYSNILSPVIRDGNGGVTSVRKTGEQSTWILTGENTYSGGTTVSDGTLQIGNGGNTGKITGDIENRAHLVFNRSGQYTFNGNISGAGKTSVSGGILILTGSVSPESKITVDSGATLGGTAVINGVLNISTGGTLSPGIDKNGKMVADTLVLYSGSNLRFDLGEKSDTVETVKLVLDGILNIRQIAGFKPGTYTILTYSGELIDSGLVFGTVPDGYQYELSSRNGKVQVSVSISAETLSAGFTASPRNGFYPLAVKFTDTSKGVIDSWQWNFGDGTTSDKKDPVHEYSKAGLYTVKLTIAGPDGIDSVIKTDYINVYSDSAKEAVSFFNPKVLFDTVKAFNGSIILWKDSTFTGKEIRHDTLFAIKVSENYEGVVKTGMSFVFGNKDSFPEFYVGISYLPLPSGFAPGDVRMYRDSAGVLLVEHGSRVDSLNKIVYTKTSVLKYPFLLLIDTLPPVIEVKSDTEAVCLPNTIVNDTFTVRDNIFNTYWNYVYGRGEDSLLKSISGQLNGKSKDLQMKVPGEAVGDLSGLRALLIVSDGAHTDTVNVSRKVRRDISDPCTTSSMEWYPLSVTADLDSSGPEYVIARLSEFENVSYDNRFMRMFKWEGDKGEFVEYSADAQEKFGFIPGQTIWIKTLRKRPLHFGSGTTVSLKEPFKIELAPGEWTDISLPFAFPIRLADILENSIGSEGMQFYSWVKDSLTRRFRSEGLFVPGIEEMQDLNVVLDLSEINAFTVYNSGDSKAELKIPPIPASMSPQRPLGKKKQSGWSVKAVFKAESGTPLSRVFFGYNPSGSARWYPVPPSLSEQRVVLYNRKENKRYGHFIGNQYKGGLTQEMAFENRSSRPVSISYQLQESGNLPDNTSVLLLDQQSGKWQKSGTVTVAAKSVEYRLIVAADESYREELGKDLLSFRYSIKSLSPNPFRSQLNIRYTVPLYSNHRLVFSIFDPTGKLVWKKEAGKDLSCGEHFISWNGLDLRNKRVKSGIYFVTFSVLDSRGRPHKRFTSKITYLP